MRGATRVQGAGNHEIWISIHAPHAGSDADTLPAADIRADFNPRSPCGERRGGCEVYVADDDFNPRSPCGERPGRTCTSKRWYQFQSTLPMRGATPCPKGQDYRGNISIHAPHAGSDLSSTISSLGCSDFNPRSPCGERRLQTAHMVRRTDFNPRSPCGERRPGFSNIGFYQHFNPRSPCGERLITVRIAQSNPISIHAPHAGSDWRF